MPLCDTVLRAAEKGLCRIYFSQEILDGATRNLVETGRMAKAQAERFQSHILAAFSESLIDVPESLILCMTNHPNDRHVLAAAVAAKTLDSEVCAIVTANLKDFPEESLRPWGVGAQHPDDFLNSLCDRHGDREMAQLIREQAADCQKPPLTAADVLKGLEKGQPKFANRMRDFSKI
jgi:hypothetical protein